MPDIKRYERFGWDYDRFNPPDPEALAWYLRHLEDSGGPVLELACGSGTLLEPFARAGLHVTGLDLSDAMLGRARTRLASLPADVAGRIDLVKCDMADFDLGRTFRAVVLADNSFRELETRDALRSCLACIRRHLEDGGSFLLTERRFDASRYEGGMGDWPWTEVYRNPETGESVRRRVSAEILEDPLRIRGRMTYEVTTPDGRVEIEDCPFAGPILLPDEYLVLLDEAGFDAELPTGYDDRMLCFVATARAG